MAFKNGDKKPANSGKKKGTENIITRDAKQMIVSIIDGNLDRVQSDLDALEPFQRLQIIDRLLRYVVPTQQTVTMSADVGVANSIARRLGLDADQ